MITEPRHEQLIAKLQFVYDWLKRERFNLENDMINYNCDKDCAQAILGFMKETEDTYHGVFKDVLYPYENI